jgi:hypothetical protein
MFVINVFERIIFLGTGQLAFFCADLLKKHGITSQIYDTNTEKSLWLENMCTNGGFLDLKWGSDKMLAFLRAMDYGPLDILGKSKLELK